MANSAPLTERRYVAPFVLITSLFFLWAFGVNLNDILIPRFKNAFALSDFQSLIAEYKKYHEKIWPEITWSIKNSGIEDMEIYCLGTRMFMIMEVNEGFFF